MKTTDRGFTPNAHPCRDMGFGSHCEYEDCPSNQPKLRGRGPVRHAIWMTAHPRHLWEVTNDTNIPGNYMVISRRIDYLLILVLLIAMSWVASGGAITAFFSLAITFMFGWQYHWLQRIRAIRKEQAGSEEDAT